MSVTVNLAVIRVTMRSVARCVSIYLFIYVSLLASLFIYLLFIYLSKTDGFFLRNQLENYFCIFNQSFRSITAVLLQPGS